MDSADTVVVDISTLQIVETKEGSIILQDDIDKVKQETFALWYTSMQYWKTIGLSEPKANKIRAIK